MGQSMNKMSPDAEELALVPHVRREAIYQNKLWMAKYRKLQAFRKAFGHCNVPKPVKDPSLAQWVETQRKLKKKGKLRQDRERLLNDLEFSWSPPMNTQETGHAQWMKNYHQLVAFQAKNGHLRVPGTKNKVLNNWVNDQRKTYRAGTLLDDRKEMLDKIDFVWGVTRVSTVDADETVPPEPVNQDNVGDDGSNGGDDAILLEAENKDDKGDRVEAVVKVPVAVADVVVQLPGMHHNAREPLESSENELNVHDNTIDRSSVMRPSKRRRTLARESQHRDDVSQQAVAPEAIAPETVASAVLDEQSEFERLKLQELKRKNEWEERKRKLRERSAQLDIDRKQVELARQQLAHRMELHTHYTNLKAQQNPSYAEIARLFPAMIELFPDEEKDKL